MINLIFIAVIVSGNVFEFALLKKSEGFISFEVNGENAYNKFKQESGGHRFQRIPPTERNGRVHTSTITVVVFKKNQPSLTIINSENIEWFACRGSGNGGQNRNKRDTAVTVIHKPTGMRVRCENERSQHQNLEIAKKRLEKTINNRINSEYKNTLDMDRKVLMGSGERGDKIRTIRARDNVVTNHLNGKKMRFDEYMKGYLSKII